jgi:hypothetical protein
MSVMPPGRKPKAPRRFFSLYPREDERDGVAYAPEGLSWQRLYGCGFVHDWEVPTFLLQDGDWTDYLADNLGWHLCSLPLRGAIEKCLNGGEAAQWLPAKVCTEDQTRDYFVLHLYRASDVLCHSRCIMSGAMVVKPVLDDSLIEDLALFTYDLKSSWVYVADQIRKAVLAEGLTGVKFLKVPVVYDDRGNSG